MNWIENQIEAGMSHFSMKPDRSRLEPGVGLDRIVIVILILSISE